MKKFGLTISIITLVFAVALAQNTSISVTYGFKAMATLAEKKPQVIGIIRCGNGRSETLLGQLTRLEPTSRSLVATYSLNKKWDIAFGYQEDKKGFLYLYLDSNTKYESTAEYRSIILGIQYNFLRNRHLICHLNSYLTPELRQFFNGQTDQLSKNVSISYVGGVGADVKIWRLFYWTTNVFGETALMDYKRDEAGNFTFIPVALGINSGLKIAF